uniref:NADH dehydrogenase [ubiquinone] 1 alpha subcomplex assembly factor 3 n=1 Tax=Crassostrea virginica TaxID=6565 RepID=A0A8B8DN34_CRAVI|nr:NADH dehydrogenase [ubiquinone] 1 alpha subcomplex assembly factor 3-like [Crassostrea virginica]
MSHSRVGLLCRKLIRNHMRQCVRLDQTSAANAGKVSLNLLSDHLEDHIMIKSISQSGFLLHNENIRILGPSVFFPREVLHWNINGVEDIHEASLSLFTLLEPKIDILLFGMGDKAERLSPEALRYLKGNKISFEVLTTEKACALFNFLNGEKRHVAAALLPPKVLDLDLIVPKDDDLIKFIPNINPFDPDTPIHASRKKEKSYSQHMLKIPGERVKETATNLKDIWEKRQKANEIKAKPNLEDIMDEVEKETQGSRGGSDDKGSPRGAKSETPKINTDKDSEPPKS